MPPQQAYGLLDFVNDILRFRAHDAVPIQEIDGSARYIGSAPVRVKRNGRREPVSLDRLPRRDQ
jgi:hypothetical protein